MKSFGYRTLKTRTLSANGNLKLMSFFKFIRLRNLRGHTNWRSLWKGESSESSETHGWIAYSSCAWNDSSWWVSSLAMLRFFFVCLRKLCGGYNYDSTSIRLPFDCLLKQEAQLMLTNPRDAFRGQSRSPNSSIPCVKYSFLLVWNSNFLFKTRRFFFDIRLQKCRDLEIGVRGHSRSLKVVPFGRSCMVSY